MRLIDADAIPWTDLNSDMPNSKIKVLITFADKVNKMPTIEERKKGKWIRETKHYKDSEQEFYYYEERCSECGTKRKIGWAEARYCPMCGARLVQEGEDNDS